MYVSVCKSYLVCFKELFLRLYLFRTELLPFVFKYIGLKIWVINDKEYHLTIICKITIFLISFRESSFFSLVSDAKLFYILILPT